MRSVAKCVRLPERVSANHRSTVPEVRESTEVGKEQGSRLLAFFLSLEVLLFLLPATGNVEGHAAGYWEGVKPRPSSSRYWGIALGGGIGAILPLIALLMFSNYLARFVTPPEE